MRKTADNTQVSASGGNEPLPDPVELILQDHDRQLEICSTLEALISASKPEPVADWAASVLDYLTNDLPLHVEDEELDLFPRLGSRQPPESNLRDILDQLILEHESDNGLADLIVKDLRAIADGGSPADPARFQWNVGAFCAMQRRHLNWENRMVLPLAEALLTNEDKRDLARRMIARRSASDQS